MVIADSSSRTHSPNMPTRADTCRHMCRHLQVPTRADTRHTNHMDFFICKLGCAGMCQHLKKCRHLGRCRHVPTRQGADTCWHVPTSVIVIIWTFVFANWDVLACVSTWKVPTPGKVPTRAGMSRYQHVPISLILIIWTFLFGCWYILTCVSTWKGADTWECADTSRHVMVPTRADTCQHMPTSIILIIWTFYLQTGMCLDVSAPEKVPTPGKVPTRAGTSRCRHVLTSLILIMWTFFIWMLICTDMCQHLKRWWHLGMCWHVPTRLGSDMYRHVPTSVILIIWTFFYLVADMYWHVSAPEKVPTPGNVPTRADTSRCRHVPISVILIIWTFLFANWDVLACVITWKGTDTWEGADTCRHPWY